MTPSEHHEFGAPCYSKKEIAIAVGRIAAEINTWANRFDAQDDGDVLVLPVLRGGLFFFTDLVRELSNSVEVVPIRAYGYSEVENALRRPEVQVHLEDAPLLNRRVLVVDDICDSGRTLKKISNLLLSAGAKEVRSAVLILRDVVELEFSPDWYCFRHPGDEWFVGYGMDDKNRWRNLPDVYVIKPG